jgi:ankyrin repeat protein
MGKGKEKTTRNNQRIRNSIQDEAGNTGLMTAILNNQINETKKFLDQETNVELRNSAGESALTLGLQSKLPPDLILDILGKTKHTNQKTLALQTPLQLALETGRPSSVIKKLIKKGAGTDFVTKTGENALILAAQYSEEPEIIGILLKEGVDPKHADQAKRTAIEYARENEQINGTSEFWLLHDVS